MRIVLVADAFPPLRSSGAVQLRDLSLEFARQGCEVTVLTPAPEEKREWQIEQFLGVRVVRLRTSRTKDVGYLHRAIGEFLMPFMMLRFLRKSPLANERWDGVVWYSPTIFLGPLVRRLRQVSNCRSYLIVRDIFPEWAADMGLMGRGLPYRLLRLVANYQYSQADVIGVQTSGNLRYFSNWSRRGRRRVEVLHNWLAQSADIGCRIAVGETRLAGRIVFVYAGNMGVAQAAGVFLTLAEALKDHADIGFLFVGRGSEALRLSKNAADRQLPNVMFADEIAPEEIPGLYAQCHIGLVALDTRHKTHNIPGKFVSYMQSGLPVLASVNPGNDLVELIQAERVGRVSTDGSVKSLKVMALEIVAEIAGNSAALRDRCKGLAQKLYSPEQAVRQIGEALRPTLR